MLGQIVTENGQKKVIPLTADAGAGLPVGFIAPVYKKGNYSGWLYLDGRDTTGTSEELSTHYPLLYAFLGSNKLPDYREFALVGAEQNTTDTIATHDVFTGGEFKDDQLQNHGHSITDPGHTHSYTRRVANIPILQSGGSTLFSVDSSTSTGSSTTGITVNNPNSGRHGDVTRGKRKAVYFYIKATSGLSENAQDNVVAQLNEQRSYSTEEHLTGRKWIDGKDTYEITFYSATNWANSTVIGNIPNIDTIIKIRDITGQTGGIYVQNYGVNDDGVHMAYSYVDVSSGNVSVVRIGVFANNLPSSVTLEYTKTN